MRLEDWAVTIQKMTDECNPVQTTPDRVLKLWRVKLEKEPTLLKPFEIDQIVREVRSKLGNVSP